MGLQVKICARNPVSWTASDPKRTVPEISLVRAKNR